MDKRKVTPADDQFTPLSSYPPYSPYDHHPSSRAMHRKDNDVGHIIIIIIIIIIVTISSFIIIIIIIHS